MIPDGPITAQAGIASTNAAKKRHIFSLKFPWRKSGDWPHNRAQTSEVAKP
jgi:hypothetical protein